jgi:Histidine kinase
MSTYRNQWDRAWRTFFSYDEYDQTPQWLRLLLTVLFSMGVAAVFTVVGFVLFARGEGAWRNWDGWLEWYGRNLVVALTIGLCIYAAFYLVYTLFGEQRLRAMSFKRRKLLYSVLPLGVTAFAWPLGVLLAGGDFSNMFVGGGDGNRAARTVLMFLLIAFIFNVIFANKARAIEAEKRETEARLQLLQAQIEPHFLFNTLAGVISLIDHEPARAKTTLQAFTDYLRSSMGNLPPSAGPGTGHGRELPARGAGAHGGTLELPHRSRRRGTRRAGAATAAAALGRECRAAWPGAGRGRRPCGDCGAPGGRHAGAAREGRWPRSGRTTASRQARGQRPGPGQHPRPAGIHLRRRGTA